MKKIILAMASLLMLVGCTTNKPAEANNENELINEQLMQDNMKEVQAYLKECSAFFIATVDGDQPRVRTISVRNT